MLYTTYFSRMKGLPDNVTKLAVTRFAPKWLVPDKYPDVMICNDLSPHANILTKYRKGGNWDEFEDEFLKQLYSDADTISTFEKICTDLENGYDYAFICYEKDHTFCHRNLLGREVQKRGIEWREL